MTVGEGATQREMMSPADAMQLVVGIEKKAWRVNRNASHLAMKLDVGTYETVLTITSGDVGTDLDAFIDEDLSTPGYVDWIRTPTNGGRQALTGRLVGLEHLDGVDYIVLDTTLDDTGGVEDRGAVCYFNLQSVLEGCEL